MRIAVMAAGAVGAYFGAKLAHAGHDVTFIARGAHRDAIAKNGLKIEGTLTNITLKDAKVTDDPKSVGPVDGVLFAVKLWDTEKAAEMAKPLVGPQTRVISLQNGVDSVERMAPILGADHVTGGVAFISAVISAPGVITQSGPLAKLLAGRLDGKPDPVLTQLSEAAKAAGFELGLSTDIQRDRWTKFVFLVGVSSVTAGTRKTIGPVLDDPDTKALLIRIMQEVMAVGKARGIPLSDGIIAERMNFLQNTAPRTMVASMAHDLDRGNRMELDWLAGKVVELGRESGVPTPANEAVYALLKLHRNGRD